jgi:hypothetical protein
MSKACGVCGHIFASKPKPCHRCNDRGFYTWDRLYVRWWDVCECRYGEELAATLRRIGVPPNRGFMWIGG